jgi:hypothetical protein
VLIQFTSGGRSYLITSTSVESMGEATNARTSQADLRAKATLFDVTDLLHPVTVGSGLTLRMTATDRDHFGSGDSLGITLWNANTLLFSSEWTGAGTQELTLAGGTLIVL